MVCKAYTANNHDCVGWVLEKLGLEVQRTALPLGWWHQENILIDTLVKKILAGEVSARIGAIVFSQSALLAGDICFMRLRGKFVHHLGIYAGNGHIEHNLPGRGVTVDYLMPGSKLFIFAVRLEK